MNFNDSIIIFKSSLPIMKENIKKFSNSKALNQELDRITNILNLEFNEGTLNYLKKLLVNFKDNYEYALRDRSVYVFSVRGLDYMYSDREDIEMIKNLIESIDLKLENEGDKMFSESEPKSEPSLREINDTVKKIKEDEANKENYIFISHSMKDKNKAKTLVDYLEKLGVDHKTIICTSVEKYSPEVGEDIIDYLKQKIKKDSLFIYITSEEYFSSYFCLNEMGAAWATIEPKNHFILKVPNFDLKSNLSNTVIKSTVKYAQYDKDGFSKLFDFLKKRNYVEELGSSDFNHILDMINL